MEKQYTLALIDTLKNYTDALIIKVLKINSITEENIKYFVCGMTITETLNKLFAILDFAKMLPFKPDKIKKIKKEISKIKNDINEYIGESNEGKTSIIEIDKFLDSLEK